MFLERLVMPLFGYVATYSRRWWIVSAVRRFFGANGTESDGKFVVDRAPIPQEGGVDTLDKFYAVCVKWRARIGRYRLLGLGVVGDGLMLVRR